MTLPVERVEVEYVSEFELTWIPERGDYMRRRGIWVKKPWVPDPLNNPYEASWGIDYATWLGKFF